MSETIPYLLFNHISKSFPGVKALSDITMKCEAGKVHALMGENGAGKSTLLKILSGSYRPDQGEICIDGEPTAFSSTTEALDSGISVIYQELHLVPEMTVAENIWMGRMPSCMGVIDRKLLNEQSRQQLAHLGVDIDPQTPLKYLSIGQWQMVEIAKALARNAKVIAFDEPTSSLSAREIEQLFRVIRDLRAEGRVIIYVSHRMEEIFAISDAISVFKDGRFVRTFYDVAQVSHDQLVEAMVGRKLGDIYGYRPRATGEVRLQAQAIIAAGLRKPINLEIYRGEIVGLFGLVGAGRSELMKALFGGSRISSGSVKLDGHILSISSPADAIRHGIMLCPENRKTDGIIPMLSVQENINISARRSNLWSGFLINRKWEIKNALHHIRHLNIKTPGAGQLIMNLSGGNQQKAILGRWLSEEMRVILLDEPTRGIDVGAKHEIYQIIYALAEQGISVLFASSDLPEVLGLADRILVMSEGTLSGEISRQEANERNVLRMAMPVARENERASAAMHL